MAYAVLAMMVLVAGILLTSVIVAASRARDGRRRAVHYADGGGDGSWSPDTVGGGDSDGSDGCDSADAGGGDAGGGDAGGCDGGGGDGGGGGD